MLMKHILITIIITIALTPVTANADFCGSIAGMAGNVMKHRQDGMLMSSMMRSISEMVEEEEVSPHFGNLLRAAALLAYKQPYVGDYPDLRLEKIREFSNGFAVICYEDPSIFREERD